MTNIEGKLKGRIGRPKRVFSEDQRSHMLFLHEKTSCSMARIARHFDCSPALADRIIEEEFEKRRSAKEEK